MTHVPHPDEPLHRTQVKQITRGSRQAADDQAMNAMWEAIEAGKNREEAEEIFCNTYLKNIGHGK